MRLRKGAKVEVFMRKEVPSGSWHYAEIIGGNGHSYTIRYDCDIGSFGVAEKVSWKLIRSCPPSVDVLEDWMLGDVVEVFDNFSWKMATVLKVSKRDHLLVRLLGSSIEFKVNKVDVRARLCWHDGEWLVIGKASGKHEDTRFRFPSSRKNYNNQALKAGSTVCRRIKFDRVSSRNINNILDSQYISARTMKRKPSHCPPEFEPYSGPKQKIRLTEEHNSWCHSNVRQQPQKIDDAAHYQEKHAKKCMHSYFVNKTNRCSELILMSGKKDIGVGYLRSISLESNDDDNVSSSVGSCSVYGDFFQKLHHGLTAGPYEDNDSQFSDAESFCQLRSEEGNYLHPGKDELAEEVHKLELHAYRCIIEALHASGPLNWERELLLTNLRESLHISLHLMEIRNLVSSSACILSC